MLGEMLVRQDTSFMEATFRMIFASLTQLSEKKKMQIAIENKVCKAEQMSDPSAEIIINEYHLRHVLCSIIVWAQNT